jgi:protein-tyrosine phosphatase
MGNICRSPTAEGVFRSQLDSANLAHEVEIDSAGTGAWHVGKPPDTRAQEAALRRGVLLDDLRGRQVRREDFDRFDYIVAMDRNNVRDLLDLADPSHHHKVRLLMEFDTNYGIDEVPDPYYGGENGFERVLDMIEAAGFGLLEEVRRRIANS